ncbi:putative G-protein coupled receptor Mth-like 3 [Haemaphysalis longicornis]
MGKATPPSNFAGVSYAVVLDFSNWHALPQQHVNNTCGRDKIYDPLSKTCVQTSCPADVCVQRDDCLWTRFSRDEITFREDLSLIITSTSEQLNPDRWHRDGPDIVVCMSTKSGATAIEPIGFEEVLSNVTLFISALCLTLHIITYALLPQLRNGHSRIVLCLAVSLLVAQGTFLGSGLFLRAGMALCTACAVVSHASHLAAFFWMNVMAIDLRGTFQKRGIGKSRAQGAFLLYSAYAWMVPVALVAAALILQDLRPSSPFSPSYGRPHCWINRPFSLLAFFGAPVLLLLLANVVLFCLTAASIHQATKQGKLARRAANTTNQEKSRLVLYAKLAALLGLTWAFGFAAALSGLRFLWYPFIVLGGLQGASIFLAFTCKRRIFRMMYERVCGSSGARQHGTHSPSPPTATTLTSVLSTSSTALASVATGTEIPMQAPSRSSGTIVTEGHNINRTPQNDTEFPRSQDKPQDHYTHHAKEAGPKTTTGGNSFSP